MWSERAVLAGRSVMRVAMLWLCACSSPVPPTPVGPQDLDPAVSPNEL